MGAWPDYPGTIQELNFWDNGQLCCGRPTRTLPRRPCKRPAQKNGFCERHGGKATGPKTKAGKAKSSQNARKHGIYSHTRTLPQQEWEDDVAALRGSLDHEVDDIRFRIQSLCEVLRAIEDDDWDGMIETDVTAARRKAQMVADANGVEQPHGGEFDSIRKRTLPDYLRTYISLVGRLRSLEHTRWVLNGGTEFDPYEGARLVKKALDEMTAKTETKEEDAEDEETEDSE